MFRLYGEIELTVVSSESSLCNFNRRMLGDVGNEEVHQDVLAVRKGLNGSRKTDREVFYEELCIFSVKEGGISRDEAVLVG